MIGSAMSTIGLIDCDSLLVSVKAMNRFMNRFIVVIAVAMTKPIQSFDWSEYYILLACATAVGTVPL